MERIKGQDVAFVLSATLLTAIVDVLYYAIHDGDCVKSFLILGANYMMALGMYLLLRLADLAHLGRVIKWFFGLVISFYFSTLVFCWYCFGNPMDKVIIALIAGTNKEETHEFFQTYITPSLLVLYCLTVLLVFGLFIWLTSRQYRKPTGRLLKGLGLCVLVGCCCLGFSFYTLPGRIEGLLRTEQKDLSDYLHHPEMKEIRDSHPDIIMIVIGESFSRSHSSLYGYDKPTNPRLSLLRDSGQLITFQKVTAADTHTSEAFKHFMTTFRHDSPDEDWFRYLTLPEALHASGYHTAWFSNQAKTGWYDNVTTSFANLCDTVHFTSVTGEGEQDSRPDGIVLKCLKNYMQSVGQERRQAVFVHLMGQHVNFQQRYPANFARFKEKHYASCQESQREDFATYDNATLYNDHIVAGIFETLKGKNAIAVYFPDHGLDFYESSPDYCSHANTSKQASVEAALKIPFVIYTTESYRSTHPAVMSQLQQMSQRPFNTEDLPDLLLSVAGYQVVR
ncbi:MAG: phosphoethanolamine transferase [Prevotella sp.]|nr:phosphoethanolamine transferase [Prevotella sp.]